MTAHAGRLASRIRVHLGVIDLARGRQRRRRRRAIAGGLVVLVAAVLATLTIDGGRSPGGRADRGAAATTSAVRHLAAGRSETTFSLREPAGVILVARVSARRGVRAAVNATIPGLAAVPIVTTPDRYGRNPACSVHGAVNVCTTAVEWCPMPQATWHFRITKWTGPAGDVQVDFVVGPKPGTRTS